jgi:hypothetical protein
MTGLLDNNELNGMLKEATLVKFEVLSQHLPGGTKENHENPVRIAGIWAENWLLTSLIWTRNGTYSPHFSFRFHTELSQFIPRWFRIHLNFNAFRRPETCWVDNRFQYNKGSVVARFYCIFNIWTHIQFPVVKKQN